MVSSKHIVIYSHGFGVRQVEWSTRTELENELQEHPENYLKGLNWAVKEL